MFHFEPTTKNRYSQPIEVDLPSIDRGRVAPAAPLPGNGYGKAKSTLVVGYGHPYHRDDVIEQAIAKIVESWQLPQVQVILLHQLVPELTEALATAEQVIFVDAAPVLEAIAPDAIVTDSPLAPRSIQVQLLSPCPTAPRLGQTYHPSALLALTQVLYGRCPEAWWIQIRTGHPLAGDPIALPPAPEMEQQIATALEQIQSLV